MKLAIFEYTTPPLRGIKMYLEESESVYCENKIRFSEFVEVDFPPRAVEELVPEQIAAVDSQIAEVTDKFGKALAELKARKSELLAITQAETVE